MGGIIDIKSMLDPCIKALEGYYGVLHMVVEIWGRGGEATLYSLSEEAKKRGDALRSRGGVLNALRSLTMCGYLMRLDAGKKGKKLYLPTPLGILVDLVVGLLHPERLGLDLRGDALRDFKYRSCVYVEEILSKHLDRVFILTLYGLMDVPTIEREEGLGKSLEEMFERNRFLARGYATARIAINMLYAEPWIVPWIYTKTSDLGKNVSDALQKDLESFEQDLSDAIYRLIKDMLDFHSRGLDKSGEWEAAMLFTRSYSYIYSLLNSYRKKFEEIILSDYENIYKNTLPEDILKNILPLFLRHGKSLDS